MKYIIAFIILLLPLSVFAHFEKMDAPALPGKLPGEVWYIFERPFEWIDVNLFTISTKKKQEKKLAFASERAAELGALLEISAASKKDYDLALSRYQYYLGNAEYMAEVIIFLDGHEIATAERFEAETRKHERYLYTLAGLNKDSEFLPEIKGMLGTAMQQNAKMLRFMIEKYQADENDIKKHQNILGSQIDAVEQGIHNIHDGSIETEVSALLAEAKKYTKAGLNLEALDLLVKAKKLSY